MIKLPKSRGKKEDFFKFLIYFFPCLIDRNSNKYTIDIYDENNYLFKEKIIESYYELNHKSQEISEELFEELMQFSKKLIEKSIKEKDEIYMKSSFGKIINGLNYFDISYKSISTEEMKNCLEELKKRLNELNEKKNTLDDLPYYDEYNKRSSTSFFEDIKESIETELDDICNKINTRCCEFECQDYKDLLDLVYILAQKITGLMCYPNNKLTSKNIEKCIEKLQNKLKDIETKLKEYAQNPRSHSYCEYKVNTDSIPVALDLLPNAVVADYLKYNFLPYLNFVELLENGYYDEFVNFNKEKIMAELTDSPYGYDKFNTIKYCKMIIKRTEILIEQLKETDTYKEIVNSGLDSSSEYYNFFRSEYYELLIFAIDEINKSLTEEKSKKLVFQNKINV